MWHLVSAAIRKMILATIVHLSQIIDSQYTHVSRVCALLSVWTRGPRLKWWYEHVNWIVSDWGNIMFTIESRFALKPHNNCVRVQREQDACNRPENITEHHIFRDGSIIVWTEISLGYRNDVYRRCSVKAESVSKWSPRPHYETVRYSSWSFFRFSGR